ncbi:type IV pilus biogenesis protein PilM [Paraburkholderia sediminicola]|uniref:type IV pilus biogenesis protein PilM n=1 Tax=Paraburkholderia sediminicola TaxID=458836 RepID=UPI0038B6D22A
MYMLWALAFVGMLTGAYALLGSETNPSMPSAATVNLASSLSAYRQAVITYVLANPGFAGSVPADSLTMPAGTQTTSLQNYVLPNSGIAGSLVVVYGTSALSGSAASDIEQMAQGSALAGVKQGGFVQSPGNPPVPLPAALVNSVPNGAAVWMAQAYD